MTLEEVVPLLALVAVLVAEPEVDAQVAAVGRLVTP